MRYIIDNVLDLSRFQVKGGHHTMAVLNGFRDLFIDVALPEAWLAEINRLGAEGTGRRSVAFSIYTVAYLTFVAVKGFPLGVFVRSGILDGQEYRCKEQAYQRILKNSFHQSVLLLPSFHFKLDYR